MTVWDFVNAHPYVCLAAFVVTIVVIAEVISSIWGQRGPWDSP